MREVKARYTDDERREEAMARSGDNRTKKRRRVKKQFWVVLVLFLAAAITALCLTVLFPVKEVSVTGSSRYSLEEIKNVADIKTGSNIIMLDTDKISSRIEQLLPDIGNAEVSKKLSGSVVINVSELSAVYAYYQDGVYFLVNEKGKVFQKMSDEPSDICVVRGLSAADPQVGSVFTPENTELKALFDRLVELCAANSLTVTRIDLSDIGDIWFVYDGRLCVRLGTQTDIEYKVSHAAASIGKMASTDEGTLDLTWWTTTKKDAYFRRGDIGDIIAGVVATGNVVGDTVDENGNTISVASTASGNSSTSSKTSSSSSSTSSKTSSASSSSSSKTSSSSSVSSKKS